CSGHLSLLPFPTRRSSDLVLRVAVDPANLAVGDVEVVLLRLPAVLLDVGLLEPLAENAGLRSHLLLRQVLFLEEFLRIQRARPRSEEHTSELQSRFDLVCR